MKVIIFCGGLGTRLREETEFRPKPMVEIGGYPILWHIMNIYSSHQFNDFVLALGYKGESIKEYFLNYFHHSSDLKVNLKTGEVDVVNKFGRDWTVELVDTGIKSMTGGRLLRLKGHVENQTFMVTYGDGISNVNIKELLAFHRSHGKLATVSAVRPSARFGEIIIDNGLVKMFKEKPQTGEGWINGGFFVFEPGVFDYLEGDDTVFEAEPMERLAADGQLMAYKHEGFWQCMDTVRDRDAIVKMWDSGNAPWKTWK